MVPLERLRRGREIKRVLRTRKAVSTHVFTLKFLKNGSRASRLCIIVSTKVSKKATERNRIRRRLSEAFRRDDSNVPTGYDIVVIAQKRALTVPFDQITQAVAKSLTSLRR